MKSWTVSESQLTLDLAPIRDYFKIDGSGLDARLETSLRSAIKRVEQRLGIAILDKVVSESYDAVDLASLYTDYIRVQFPPIKAVTEIKVSDIVLSTDYYQIIRDDAILFTDFTEVVPDPRQDNALVLTYSAGYGSVFSEFPLDFQTFVLAEVDNELFQCKC